MAAAPWNREEAEHESNFRGRWRERERDVIAVDYDVFRVRVEKGNRKRWGLLAFRFYLEEIRNLKTVGGRGSSSPELLFCPYFLGSALFYSQILFVACFV